MHQLQRWFDRIAGVTEEERRRMDFAQDFFGQRGLDTTPLQTPACWRRSGRAAQSNGNGVGR